MNSHNLLAPRLDAEPVSVEADVLARPAPKRPRRVRNFFATLAVLGLLTTIVLTFIGIAYLLDGALRVKAAMSEGETALEATDFPAAIQALNLALAGIEEMQAGLPFLSYLKPVPWVGDQLKGGAAVLEVSHETVEAILTGVSVAEEVLNTVTGAGQVVGGASGEGEVRPYSDLSAADKRLLLTGLAASLPELREMQVRLRLAQADLDRLDNYRLTPAIDQAIEPLRELIPELLTSVDVLVPFAAIAPEYGGLSADKQFLVLFLNNTELRPGGGFIGVYGLMVMRDGEIKNLVTADSYSIDAFVQGHPEYHVNPPPPLVSYLNQPVWYFRDSDWSPDFYQTSQDAVQLMRQEIAFGGQPVPDISGVVGLTPTFISRLLAYVGPITVEGQTFTSDNIADLLEYQVEKGFEADGIPLAQRKDIVSTLTNELVDELLALPPSDWPNLFKILHAGFEAKEFVLMSNDSKTQAALEDSGWSGTLNPAQADDVLLVVDANLAALKTDPVVERHIDYSVRKTGHGYQATTSIKYDHHGGFDWKTTRYRTYTRVYAPLGSVLVSSSGSLKDDKTRNPGLLPGTVTVADELGMTSFGAFTAIEPGQSGTLTFTYDLPANVAAAIDRGTYRLLTFKQLGAGDNLLTLNLDFGKALVSALPAEEAADFGDDVYHVTIPLDTDKLFTVRLK